MKATAIHDLIVAVTDALDAAVSYPVFDGPISDLPSNVYDRYVVIGADEPVADPEGDGSDSARMTAEWHGLGAVMREESVDILCLAVGRVKKKAVRDARAAAKAALQDVADHLSRNPTPESYGAHVSEVNAMRSKNVPGGAVVYIQFIISATARLT